MKVMDSVFFEAEGKMSDNELQILIKRYLPNLTDMQIQDEMKRMHDKYNTWSNLYFHWYFILIAFVCGIIGWFIPAVMVKFRAFLIKK